VSQIHIPTQLLVEMDRMVRVDQGNRFRGFLRQVLPHIGDAYRQDEEPFRTHLGASIIGGECARAIYYSHRWASRSEFSGQMIRLFNRGHLEEGRSIALLLTVGCEVYQQDEHGRQYRISHAGGHMGGSGDGVVIGVPDLAQGVAALSEFKTHNTKSFAELAGDNWRKYVNHLIDPAQYPHEPFSGKGVREAKTEHYVQMQIYMRKMGLAVALYFAVCKDTDDIYCELVPLDANFADQFLERGRKLVFMDKPPDKLSKSPGFFKCRFCDHRPVCHLGKPAERNCRTCSFSHPREDTTAGEWFCRLREMDLPKKTQFEACEHYAARKDF
jgi:hypothetical protein